MRSSAVKKQILIVDDDQRVLDALRRTLRNQSDDWSVTFVRHPEAAWEQLLEAAYDAVVTDVKMPGVTAWTCWSESGRPTRPRTCRWWC